MKCGKNGVIDTGISTFTSRRGGQRDTATDEDSMVSGIV